MVLVPKGSRNKCQSNSCETVVPTVAEMVREKPLIGSHGRFQADVYCPLKTKFQLVLQALLVLSRTYWQRYGDKAIYVLYAEAA